MELENEAVRQIAHEIAEKLGETDEIPVRQIEAIVKLMGEEFARARLEEALKIQSEGGMKTDDGQRERTVGGIFFYRVKGQLNKGQKATLFPNFGKKRGLTMEWAERTEYLAKLYEARDFGKMHYVNITLQGRPSAIAEHGNTIVMPLVYEHKPAPYPQGVPRPPLDPSTYIIYMARKHWEAITESLQADANDRMVIDGTCFHDRENEAVAVFAINVTTRHLRKAANAAQDDGEGLEVEAGGEDTKAQPAQPAPDEAKPKKQQKPAKAPAPALGDVPPEVAKKLKELHSAADILRNRIAAMESSGQAGVSMTKKLLRDTERRIAAIEKEYAQP